MSKDLQKIKFILEKIDDIDSFREKFQSISFLLNDKMGFDATLMSLLQIGETLNKLENLYLLLNKNEDFASIIDVLRDVTGRLLGLRCES